MEEKRDGCVECVRYSFLVLNTFLMLLGIILIFLGVWFYATPANKNLAAIVFDEKNQSQFQHTNFLIISIGVGICVTAFLSCCYAFENGKCISVTIFFLTLMLVVAELLIIGFGVVYIAILASGIDRRMAETLATSYAGDNAANMESAAWRETQKYFSCCGINTPQGYQNHTNVQHESITGSLWYRKNGDPDRRWPGSCCKTPKKNTPHGNISCSQEEGSYLNENGCQNQVESFLQVHLLTAIGLASLAILFHVLAVVLCCKLSRRVPQKDQATPPGTKGYDRFGSPCPTP